MMACAVVPRIGVGHIDPIHLQSDAAWRPARFFSGIKQDGGLALTIGLNSVAAEMEPALQKLCNDTRQFRGRERAGLSVCAGGLRVARGVVRRSVSIGVQRSRAPRRARSSRFRRRCPQELKWCELAQSASQIALNHTLARADHDRRMRDRPRQTRRGRAPASLQVRRVGARTKRSAEENKTRCRPKARVASATPSAAPEFVAK